MSALIRFAKSPDLHIASILAAIVGCAFALGVIFGPVLFPGVCS